MNVFKFLGKDGRTTIPIPIREKLGWERGDLISFTEQDDGSVVLRREYVCDGCYDIPTETDDKNIEEKITIKDCLDNLNENEQHEALVYLTMKWASKKAGVKR